MNHLKQNGAVIFKNFDISKTPEGTYPIFLLDYLELISSKGFRRVWETLDMAPCLDPIHNSGLRSFLSSRSLIPLDLVLALN